ncbi:MAG: diguanylate cyclase [Pseudomonadota bacterium]|nr:diguanylate cyclase [Pseudomonadota bacterium]
MVIFFAALLVRFAVLPVESRLAFLLFYPAAVVAFLACGRGPGRLAVGLSAVAGYYIFEPPHWSFGYSHEGALSVSVFVVSSLLIGWVVERLQTTAIRLNSALSGLQASESFMHRTGRVASVGGWQLDLASNTVTWSEQTRLIHEVGPDFVPTLESAIAFYAPQARDAIAQAVRIGTERGQAWDLELPLVTATGRAIWVRAVGEVEFKDQRPVRLVGAIQDITERKHLENRLAESELFVRQVTDSLPVRIAYTDRDGRYRFVNLAHSQRFECDRELIIGRTRGELKRGTHDTVVDPRIEAALAGIASVTERSAAERALRELTATLRSVTEAIPSSVAIIGIDGRYRFANSAFERWFGEPREQIIGRTVQEILGEQEFKRRRPWIERALAGESVTFELAHSGHNGATHASINYIPLRLDTGELDGFVAVTQDVTRQKDEADRLLQLSQSDPLTGLLNRAGFEQHLERGLQADGTGLLALLYIDLDHFKPVNDQHGHPAGDQVLQIFSRRLLNLVRPKDAVARLGGDEFVIALTDVREIANARAVAAKVLAAAKAPFHLGELTIHIGASVGVAFSDDPAIGWRELIEQADTHLLAAKAAGKGRQAGD